MAKDPAELLAELEAQIGAPPEETASDAELVDRRLTLHMNYRCGDGRTLAGTCIYEVPSVGDLRRIAALRARLRGGGDPLDDSGEVLIEAIAYLTVTLGDRRPRWLGSVDEIPDINVLLSLYGEAKRHEARFLEAGRDLRPSAAPRA